MCALDSADLLAHPFIFVLRASYTHHSILPASAIQLGTSAVDLLQRNVSMLWMKAENHSLRWKSVVLLLLVLRFPRRWLWWWVVSECLMNIVVISNQPNYSILSPIRGVRAFRCQHHEQISQLCVWVILFMQSEDIMEVTWAHVIDLISPLHTGLSSQICTREDRDCVLWLCSSTFDWLSLAVRDW